ncbi:MAG: MFS transporter [Odoribacteraceae bacterium]|jgi:EmrB/QacA subfamily drug resistance transporter|nr:MFS transporter [Odoribacteraceae bacterium]
MDDNKKLIPERDAGTDAGTTAETTGREAKRGLLVIAAASFMVPFMASALNLAMPEIGARFAMTAGRLAWVATAYLISTAILQVPLSRLADMVGRRKIFCRGVLLFSVATFACGLAPSGWALLATRFISGAGSAMMFGTGTAILTSLFPPGRRGWALGINVAVVYAALAAGPFLGGMLTHHLGWEAIFFVSGGAGIGVLVLARRRLRGEWVEARGERFDWTGSILYGLGLAGVIYGFSALSGASGWPCLVMGTAALVVFALHERRHASPVFNVRLLAGNRVFAMSLLAALINYAATAGIAFMLSLYLQYVRGMDARHAGLILICQACVQSVCSLVSGRLSDRFSPARLATWGMAISVAGLAELVFLAEGTPPALIIGLLAVLGVGFGIFSSPNTNLIMSSVARQHYGQAAAISGTVRLAGQAISMGIAGMVISFYAGERVLTPALHAEITLAARVTFLIFLALCLVGVRASGRR